MATTTAVASTSTTAPTATTAAATTVAGHLGKTRVNLLLALTEHLHEITGLLGICELLVSIWLIDSCRMTYSQ